ncbi:MAG: hypothetical protein WD772_10465, partial [Pseudohongiellaceae bacterium]
MISLDSTHADPNLLDHALHMGHAIRLAQNVLTTTPNPRVGCVIVGADNEIVGVGWHQVPGQAHAEI